jgi:opacity protein-like surface antigen
MKSCLKYTAAALGLMLASTAASAADLPPPPPPPMPAAWSFTIFGGASWLNDIDNNFDVVVPRDEEGFFDPVSDIPFYLSDERYKAEASFDTGFLIGGTFGYTFVDWARTELEISYASYDLNDVDVDFRGCNNGDCEDNVFFNGDPSDLSVDGDGSIGILTIMGNMWLGFGMLPVIGDPVNTAGTGLGFSPYFGGGLGVAFVDGSSGDELDIDDNTTAFAWQVGAGVRWYFSSNMGVDLGYRYRGVTDVSLGDENYDLNSHNVILGLTFNF